MAKIDGTDDEQIEMCTECIEWSLQLRSKSETVTDRTQVWAFASDASHRPRCTPLGFPLRRCEGEKRTFLRRRVETRLCQLYLQQKKYEPCLTLLAELLRHVTGHLPEALHLSETPPESFLAALRAPAFRGAYFGSGHSYRM